MSSSTMSKTISRRSFLKILGAGAAAIPIASLMAHPLLAMAKRVPYGQQLIDAVRASDFNSIPSNMVLGQPLVDISTGWDGTFWGMDRNGVPYHFDKVSQTWDVYSQNYSAVTYVSQWKGYTDASSPKLEFPLVVRGAEVLSPVSAFAQPITSVWSSLPDTFQLGLDGAAECASVLYLFRHGRYVTINDATGVASAPQSLHTFANWPQTANWIAGSIDAIGSNAEQPENPQCLLWCNGEYVIADMVAKSVVDGPYTLDWFVAGPLNAVMKQGFQATTHHTTNYDVKVFQGIVEWESTEANGGVTPSLISLPTNNASWSPTMIQSPTGVVGALYSIFGQVTSPVPAGSLLMHDGTSWQGDQTTPYWFSNISAGQDGTVFAVTLPGPSDTGTNYGLRQLQPDGVSWQLKAQFAQIPEHLSVADAGHIWLLDTSGNVYNLQGGTFVQEPNITGAAHIAANPDGTVWHVTGDPNAYRFISERTAPPTQLPNAANGNNITKVASLGFGTAFLLAENNLVLTADGQATSQVYDYDSLYAFKTSKTYIPVDWYAHNGASIIPVGAMVYVLAADGIAQDGSFLVALDAQTGNEVWPSRFALPYTDSGQIVNGMVYDPAFNLLYVSVQQDIYAVNGATGALVWAYTDVEGDGAIGPVNLTNGLLTFGAQIEDSLYQYQIDVVAAFQSGSPTATSSVALPNGGYESPVGATVTDSNGINYLVYEWVDEDNGNTHYQVAATRSTDGSLVWTQDIFLGSNDSLVMHCFLGAFKKANAQNSQPALYVNGLATIYAFDTVDGSPLGSWSIPSPANAQVISSRMSYYNDTIYVGDSIGNLFVLNALNLTLVTRTNDTPAQYSFVNDAPAVLATSDPTDTVAVYFTRGQDNLYLFDPTTGNLEQVATDLTSSTNIAFDSVHGLLYCMGYNDSGSGMDGQFFALRPYQAIQDERSFIVESQMMQDFASDDEVTGNGVARFQTHISIVDNTNQPRAYTSVKVWAEEDDTPVLIDGTAYTIGTNTPAYFTTDGSGTFTITSEATDLFTNSYMVWAAFMDPSERITIVPDIEFHQRLTSTVASGNTDPSQADPSKVDLSSAASYDGTALFANNTSDQSNATQAASAIAATTGAVGLGSASAASGMVRTAGGTNMRGANGKIVAAGGSTTAKYTAYSTLPGSAYSAVAAAANQSLANLTPAGISMTSSGYTSLKPADAANAIDAMTGDEVILITAASVNSLFSKLRSAWETIKKDAQKVTQAVISVAKDISIGIQFIVNGVTTVVKAIANDVKDLMVSIGSFFVQLGKDLVNAIEALSILLHLGEIVKTANIITDQINGAFSDLSTILTNGKTIIDGWFNSAEQTITNGFCDLYSALGLTPPAECGPNAIASAINSTPISGYSTMGATPTTVYNNGVPQGNSQSVQCGWSTHVMRNNLGSATSPDSSAAGGDDPLTAALNGFISSLTNNAILASAYSGVGNSFKDTFKVNSVEQFFAMALEDLLEVVKAVAITGVAIGEALVDGVMSVAETVVNGLQSFGNIDIPILSALWKKITGDDLTILGLVSLVMAFPVTILYRTFAGHWPSQDISAAETNADATTNIMGLVGGISMVALGVATSIIDGVIVSSNGQTQPRTFWRVIALFSFMTNAGLNIYKAAVSGENDDAINIAYLSTGIVVTTLIAIWFPPIATWVNVLLNGLLLYIYVDKFLTSTVDPLLLARQVLGSIPGIVNPTKLLNKPFGYIAPVADFGGRCASGVIAISQTALSWNTVSAPPPDSGWSFNSYFPVIANNGEIK